MIEAAYCDFPSACEEGDSGRAVATERSGLQYELDETIGVAAQRVCPRIRLGIVAVEHGMSESSEDLSCHFLCPNCWFAVSFVPNLKSLSLREGYRVP